MKIICDRAELMAAINTVSRSCAVKSPIPALEGILLEAQSAGLQLTGYDLKKGIYTSIDATVPEVGSVVLGAKIFGDIVRAMPSGEVTIIADKNNNVTIKGDKSEFAISGSDFNDYPELPDVDSKRGISLPANTLGDMIRQIIFAISDNEARPIYTGALFQIKDGCLSIVAVDGYRLALRREEVEGLEGELDFVVPGKSLSDLEKLCGESEEKVTLILGTKHISFTIGRTVLVSRRLEGDFMNYQKAVPASFANTVSAKRTAVQRAVERVSLVIDDKIKNPVRCTFSLHQIRMNCATATGKAEDVCVVDGDGKETEIGFNNRYLLDALKAAPADDIKICFNTGSSPCVIVPEDDSDKFLYMILPVRLRAD